MNIIFYQASIKVEFPIRIFKVDEIWLNTGIELKENLDNGEIAFIVKDRLSKKK